MSMNSLMLESMGPPDRQLISVARTTARSVVNTGGEATAARIFSSIQPGRGSKMHANFLPSEESRRANWYRCNYAIQGPPN